MEYRHPKTVEVVVPEGSKEGEVWVKNTSGMIHSYGIKPANKEIGIFGRDAKYSIQFFDQEDFLLGGQADCSGNTPVEDSFQMHDKTRIRIHNADPGRYHVRLWFNTF